MGSGDVQAVIERRAGIIGRLKEELIRRFNLPFAPEDLRAFDPCHLIMCEVAAQACHHAGLDPRTLPPRNTGVYIGHTGGSPLGGDLALSTLAAEVVLHRFLRLMPAAILKPTCFKFQISNHKQIPSSNNRMPQQMKTVCLFENSNFGFVSNFDIRVSNLSRG